MASITERFGKYIAELEPNSEREQAMDVFVSYKTKTREYTASLNCLMDTGELESSDGMGHKVESAIIDDIETWAIENGY
jgi:hypothetical protein